VAGPGLPDAWEWSITLASAIIQTLLGQRPVSHPILSKSGFRARLTNAGRSGQWPAAPSGETFLAIPTDLPVLEQIPAKCWTFSQICALLIFGSIQGRDSS
jgi:hypothetical protein